jgi:Ca2+-binding RTX toxin-like protein
VRVSLATGNGVGGDAQDDTLINIENLAGSAFADFLTGDRFANVLQGNGGDDRFIGGGGGDHLIGGNGFDTAEYSDSLTGVTVNLATGEASGGTAQDDRLDGIEAVVGSLFDDFLIGDELNNGLFGAAGDDNLNGGEGHDRVIGGSGNDNVKGAAGNDRLEGGIGNDWILGGIGRDIMLGGEEADTFAWQSTAETGLNGTTADVVDDFSRAEGDLLDFWAIDADTTASGNQSFAFIGNQAFTAAGQLRCFTSGNHTYIELNTDGDSDREAVIDVTGVHIVDASWFLL